MAKNRLTGLDQHLHLAHGVEKAPACTGCEFVRQFSPHDGGYCQVHGDIKGTLPLASTVDKVIDVLGGNDLSLEEDV